MLASLRMYVLGIYVYVFEIFELMKMAIVFSHRFRRSQGAHI
jgi:hypothetical protein